MMRILGFFALLGLVVGGFSFAAAASCTIPKAPKIKVKPITHDIVYDFSRSATELSRVQADGVNPYGPNADTITGGLRHDTPRTEMSVKWGYRYDPNTGEACLFYDTVNVKIELQPKVYVASEYGGKGKCHDAVLEHELMHVVTDRKIMNRHARRIGAALQRAVNEVGPVGPYNKAQIERAGKNMVEHLQSTLRAQTIHLEREMRDAHGQIDTFEEYERVGAICKDAMARAGIHRRR